MDLRKIQNSPHFTDDEKMRLTSLVTDAAECTNGLTELEKVQNLSETTFGIVTAIVNLTEQLNQNNSLTKEVRKTLEQFRQQKTEIEMEVRRLEKGQLRYNIKDLHWKDIIKFCFMKPWIWIFLSTATFSPKGIEILNFLVRNL